MDSEIFFYFRSPPPHKVGEWLVSFETFADDDKGDAVERISTGKVKKKVLQCCNVAKVSSSFKGSKWFQKEVAKVTCQDGDSDVWRKVSFLAICFH